ncbi:MAG TPA: UDP-N-acetylmuramate--L-alanine ligase [Kiritimatiellia bacterium]|jgi:UDP-N-acetylmuramate--alanine ligase|nr:UDP-N-acetylmuramate--L-alanine ligase [Kiritimatiellia bacterium]
MTPPAEPWRAAIRRWLAQPAHVHLLGIGGIGMAGLARLLAARGQHVSGCDAATPRTLRWLQAQGIPATTGHDPAHLADAQWAIHSPAVPADHPEMLAAARLPLFRRGQVLPVLAEQWQTIAVAGTHGKTTTAAMITHILRHTGADPSWCIGGELAPDHAPAGIGTGPWLVIEADESDATLAHYAPAVALITNIEFDHMEHFTSPAHFTQCFRAYARQARHLVYCADDPAAAALGAEIGGLSYGLTPAADYRAENPQPTPAGTRATLRGTQLHIPIPGPHNLLNALGAIAAVSHCGIDLSAAAAALATFALPRRRFEQIAHARGIRIIADYAHHPAEIRALIAATRQTGADRIWAIFQPHRYTRTRALGPDFPPAFDGITGLILLPVYAASEPPLPGGTSADLLKHLWRHNQYPAELAADLPAAARAAAARWQPGDTVLVIGAGDVEQIAPHLQALLHAAQ